MKIFNSHVLKDKLVQENLERVEVAGLRYYQDSDGYLYKSVTSFLSKFSTDNSSLQEWKKRVGEEAANEISRLAAWKGTNIHLACEKYLTNESDYTSHLYYDELFDWNILKPTLEKRIDNILGLEIRLKSKILQLAGTADCIAEFDGELSLIDFKTSKRDKLKEDIWSYWIQTAAYSFMVYEMYGILIKKLVIVMIVDKTHTLVHIEDSLPWMKEIKKLTKEYNNVE